MQKKVQNTGSQETVTVVNLACKVISMFPEDRMILVWKVNKQHSMLSKLCEKIMLFLFLKII